jgi:hypothetical protein
MLPAEPMPESILRLLESSLKHDAAVAQREKDERRALGRPKKIEMKTRSNTTVDSDTSRDGSDAG